MKLKPERWQQIEKIYYAALDRDKDRRANFITEACGSDDELRREVESLLASHERAEGFLDSPALDIAARMIADEQEASIVGTAIGPYKILSLLGVGGMGEVYLAQDVRLGRRVALKLLPVFFTKDKDRVRRFEQEARAASALNHPNILTIYEIGQIEGIHFIATEFIEGDTLRQILATGQLKLSDALDVATQTASALVAAHQAGIVHRDIKPENIMLRRDGYLKVLDFGLVKLTEQNGPPANTAAPTIANVKTDTGFVMGTANYMSPEQARALAVDSRTDIFSLGVVMYEMIAGRSPFQGASTADVLVSILEKEPPPLASLITNIPAELERIVAKALAKNREQRYQSAQELVVDLKKLRQRQEIEAELGRYVEPETKPVTAIHSRITEQLKLTTGAELAATTDAEDKQATREDKKASATTAERRAAIRPMTLVVIAALIAAAGAAWFYWHSANIKWAKEQIPRIEELAKAKNYFAAYDLASQARKYISDDAALSRLMHAISDTVTIKTEPAGARVYLKRFSRDESGKIPPRQLIGTTPLSDQRIARGDYLLEIEKEGYAESKQVFSNLPYNDKEALFPRPISLEQKLVEAEKVPDRMVFVPGGQYRLVSWRRPTDARITLDDYLIDKYEVTNQEYKEFINAGGYLKKQFWKHAFVKDGRTLQWEEAMREFKDRTGLAGPRSWTGQNFPEGKADHPVTDLTWYEAAAYAEFRGKRLPTVFQWEKAARNGAATFAGLIMPWGLYRETTDDRANFKGNGTMPVDSFEFGISPYGCYNMAGNVAEWCLNANEVGFTTSGGSWEDPSYLFGYYGAYPGFHKSNKLGFRCVINSAGATSDQGAMAIKAEEETPKYTSVNDAEYKALAKHYEYEKGPLDAEIIEVKETAEWRREKIAYNGANDERVLAYLYLPKNFQKPFQVVHVTPAGDVSNRARSLPDSVEASWIPFIKSGRAIFTVVQKGFIERDRPPGYTPPSYTTIEFVEECVNTYNEIRRGIDYLETREDIDASRIAFFGPSSAWTRTILPAIESRYRTVILPSSCVRPIEDRVIAAARSINFIPRIRPPKLVMLGRYDEAAPLKTEGQPLYDLMRQPKRLIIFEGGHIPAPEVAFPIVNAWLDETMGPVKPE